MPLVVEHLRKDAKSHPDHPLWEQVEHCWTMNLTLVMSHLIEEDGGPAMAYGTGYGIHASRMMCDHTFTLDYLLPDGEPRIQKGDRIRMWRER